jgi:hypothetical protein
VLKECGNYPQRVFVSIVRVNRYPDRGVCKEQNNGDQRKMHPDIRTTEYLQEIGEISVGGKIEKEKYQGWGRAFVYYSDNGRKLLLSLRPALGE